MVNYNSKTIKKLFVNKSKQYRTGDESFEEESLPHYIPPKYHEYYSTSFSSPLQKYFDDVHKEKESFKEYKNFDMTKTSFLHFIAFHDVFKIYWKELITIVKRLVTEEELEKVFDTDKGESVSLFYLKKFFSTKTYLSRILPLYRLFTQVEKIEIYFVIANKMANKYKFVSLDVDKTYVIGINQNNIVEKIGIENVCPICN